MSQLTQLKIARFALQNIANTSGDRIAVDTARSALAFMGVWTDASQQEIAMRAWIVKILEEATSKRTGSKPEIARMARQALEITAGSIAAKCDGDHAAPACE